MTIFRNGVGLYLLIAFGFSWAIGWLVYATGAMDNQLLFSGLALVYMSGPMIGALVCAWMFDKGRRRETLGIAFKINWVWLWAWALPLALIIGAMAVDLLFSPARFDPAGGYGALLDAQGQDVSALPLGPGLLFWLTVGSAVTLGAVMNMFLTLTEEFGWRGFLWDRWRRFGFWRGNLLIGLVWGVWHAPLIVQGYNYPGLPLWGPVIMIGVTLFLAPLIGWVREAGGTVFHAGLFHGTLNAAAALGLMALTGLAGPFKGSLGLSGFAAGLILCGVIFAVRRSPHGTGRRDGIETDRSEGSPPPSPAP